MSNSLKKYGLALLVLVTFVFIYESSKTKPLRWYESYDNTDKNPYGLYILDQEIEQLLKEDSITRFTSSIYDFFDTKMYDTLQPSNLILLSYQLADLDEYTGDYLKSYIEEGNTAFFIQSEYNDSFLELFGLEQSYSYDINWESQEPNTILELSNTQLTKQKFTIRNKNYSYHFELVDSLKHQIDVLGYKTMQDTIKQVNLVRVRQGKGQLILGFDPIILTNYYLLQSNNHLYAEGLFSYLPKQKTYFYGKSKDAPTESTSMLRFIFAHVALKWAWYFFLFALILFTFFTTKRKQRIIPINKPVRNTTVQFTKTVSNLYIQAQDYQDLIQKGIIYTLEKIRREYYIDTAILDDTFIHHYHLKSNKEKQDIEAFVQFVNQFRKQEHLATQADLVQFNRLTQKIID